MTIKEILKQDTSLQWLCKIQKNKLQSVFTLFSEPTKSGDSSPSEPKHIIVEIEDERIKSQLIANAMKKAISKGKKGSKSSGSSKVENNVVIMKASDALKVEFVK